MLNDNLPPDVMFGCIDFTDASTVVVAISGGSDSTALLLLLRDYFQKRPASPRIIAVTIDHGLRSESSREALEVHAECLRNHIEHRTEVWVGEKPAVGIQAAARNARYALLSKVAIEVGAPFVLTGHTLDDQLETVAMRQQRDDSLHNAGLAGIAPSTLAFNDSGGGEPVWFVRPLLKARRAALRDYLQSCGIGWIDDPSNTNEKYERVVVRQSVLDETTLVRVQCEATLRRTETSRGAAKLIERFAEEVTPGLVFVAPEIGGEPFAAEALMVLIAFAGGAGWLAEPSCARFILQGMADFKAGARKVPQKLTASGALIDVRKSGVFLLREKREVLETSKRAAYDGFYRDVAMMPALSLTHSSQGAVRDLVAPASLIAHARAVHPELESEAMVRRLINPWPDLVPLFDLEMAQALAKMAGLSALPGARVYFDDKN